MEIGAEPRVRVGRRFVVNVLVPLKAAAIEPVLEAS